VINSGFCSVDVGSFAWKPRYQLVRALVLVYFICLLFLFPEFRCLNLYLLYISCLGIYLILVV
jgi:hypothetical protein